MSETYPTYLVWDECSTSGNLEYKVRSCGRRVRAVPFDRDKLLAIADEMDMDAGCHSYVDDYAVSDYARRIREVLEVSDD